MAITVILNIDGKSSKMRISKGEKIHFEHPGAPLQVRSKDDTTLLVVHPNRWTSASYTETEDN